MKITNASEQLYKKTRFLLVSRIMWIVILVKIKILTFGELNNGQEILKFIFKADQYQTNNYYILKFIFEYCLFLLTLSIVWSSQSIISFPLIFLTALVRPFLPAPRTFLAPRLTSALVFSRLSLRYFEDLKTSAFLLLFTFLIACASPFLLASRSFFRARSTRILVFSFLTLFRQSRILSVNS